MVSQELSATGVSGRPLEVIIKDTNGSPDKTVTFCKELIDDPSVLAILGPSTTGELLQVKPLCEEAHIPLICYASGDVILEPPTKYTFKTSPRDVHAAALLFKAMKDKGVSRIGLITDNTGFGKMGWEMVDAMAPDYGITVVERVMFDRNATDVNEAVDKLKPLNIDGILTWASVPTQGLVAKTMRQIGMGIPVFQSHGFGNIKYVEQGGIACEGTIFPGTKVLLPNSLPEGHPQKAFLAAYKRNYEERFGEPAMVFGTDACDALMIAVKAVELGGTDREKLRDTIENMKGYVGAGGVFSFSPEDHNGLGPEAFDMLVVRSNRFAFCKRPEKPATPAATR